MIPITDLAAQQSKLRKDIEKRIIQVLDHGRYIMGPEVDELENALKDYVGVKHCISVANGTDALQISLMALGVGPGDEVITPAFSYFATVETVMLLGAKPVLVDIDLDTYLMSPKHLEEVITDRTKAVIPVSLYGQVADLDQIGRICSNREIALIEDAAQSFGGSRNGKKSCAFGEIGCTSFFPSKPLGCYGDGGAIFTDNDNLATILRQTARHGQEARYHHVRVGVNSRLDSIQAAILLSKLQILDEEIQLRESIAHRYNSGFADCTEIVVPKISEHAQTAWAQYTIRVEGRANLQKVLRNAGIQSVVHYPLPLNRQPAVSSNAIVPNSEKAAKEVLSLPISPTLSEIVQDRIVSIVRSAVK